MSKSFHRWSSETRVETAMDTALYHAPTGLSYAVVDSGGALYQVEFIDAPDGRRLHQLRRRMDYVMGSGYVARTYFTMENGRLFQLPLTWYTRHGWDFSPGYRPNNARFERLLPDRCIACHSSYPDALPFLEGKYEEMRPGIGCERCHGPGALHVAERRASTSQSGDFDNSIVNPARLPLARRLDTCEQCHVHTAINILREGKHTFGYIPSQPLRDHWAFFKTAGTIDIVSHADRLRQSPCFLGTMNTSRPLECATCHDPHAAPPDSVTRNRPCTNCHLPDTLARTLSRSENLDDHTAQSDCVSCHMPKVQEQGIPHGTFTEHWIRVIRNDDAGAQVRSAGGDPIAPFFERDITGPDAPVYRAMGKIVYGTLGPDARALAAGASELETLLQNDTTRAGALFLLGAAYEQLGRIDDAIRAHQRSIRVDADRPEALRGLAHAYLVAGTNPATVDSLYRRALELQPALAWMRAEYADFLHDQGRVAEAERAYRDALEEQPSLATAWFNLGTLLTGTGRNAGAARAYREAVLLDPQLAEGLASLFKVRSSGDTSAFSVTSLRPPLETLPVRARGPRAVSARVLGDARSLVFVNVPATTVLQIFRPNGTLVRTVRAENALSVAWDLRTDRGRLAGPGLYRIRVLGRDASGRPVAPQSFYIGLVRTADPNPPN
jgi:tetratricopeptide (TPR) repeat protein